MVNLKFWVSVKWIASALCAAWSQISKKLLMPFTKPFPQRNVWLNKNSHMSMVGIAGQHIKSLQHRGILTRDNDHTEISQKDIQRLMNDMHKLVLPPGDKILHVIPQEYTVDNEQGITDPIGDEWCTALKQIFTSLRVKFLLPIIFTVVLNAQL